MNASGDLIVLLVILAILGAAMLPRQWRPSGTAHGTARWANMDDLRRAGMLRTGDGLILGKTRTGRLIRMFRYVHLAIFSPAGGGKTVSFSMVWCMTKRFGSMVVNDPKGELYRLSAHIRRAMNHKVIRLDPARVCGPGEDTCNPLDLIGDGEECVDDCRALAEAMCPEAPEGERDPHWREQAVNVCATLLAFICTELKAEERNLTSLRALLSQENLCLAAVAAMRAKGGVFADLAGIIEQLQSKEEGGGWSKEGASVMSTLHRHTQFLSSPAIIRNTSKSSFDARELLNGNVTVYIIVAPHLQEAWSRWTRLVIASFIRLIGREAEQEN